MKTFPQKFIGLAGFFFLATAASAQDYALAWFTLDSGGSTSAGGIYEIAGGITQPEEAPMSGAAYALRGEFLSLSAAGPPEIPSTEPVITIFDNSDGSSNGFSIGNPAATLANRFCLGSQACALESVTLLLNTRDPGNPPTVRLQIYSSDPVTGGPAASTGVMMGLYGATNPIVFKLVASSYETPFTWTNAAPFMLAANQCYWAVLNVDAGEVLSAVSYATPKGSAAAFGRSQSRDGGTTWQPIVNDDNRRMVVRGTPSENSQPLSIIAVSLSGNAMQLSFSAVSGKIYVLESRADLAAGGWSTVPGTTTTGNGAILQMTIPNAFSQPQQFYRVKEFP